MLVQNKGNHSYEANGTVLNIGTNNVEENAFEAFLAHPLMAKLDEQGVFEYSKGKPSAKDTIEYIDDTFDVDTLEAMKENESRKTVLEAIDKRIAEIKGE
ncbi:hypothetical protein [Rummeliibacillus sp. TYF-LIM-RU47]|uniref:hypothetical protein n=1 Tax=Rummeliibacillus sp. TYF-LIM-RU47 TaxID=2608406 RepID=UPI00123B475D|nr:hypothetical protein [Rummeliibacillus sp. TYF-LIM-RU47]